MLIPTMPSGHYFPDDYFFDEYGNNIICDSKIYKAVGNAWTVDKIAHMFKNLK